MPVCKLANLMQLWCIETALQHDGLVYVCLIGSMYLGVWYRRCIGCCSRAFSCATATQSYIVKQGTTQQRRSVAVVSGHAGMQRHMHRMARSIDCGHLC
jgi:hypothetical protein